MDKKIRKCPGFEILNFFRSLNDVLNLECLLETDRLLAEYRIKLNLCLYGGSETE